MGTRGRDADQATQHEAPGMTPPDRPPAPGASRTLAALALLALAIPALAQDDPGPDPTDLTLPDGRVLSQAMLPGVWGPSDGDCLDQVIVLDAAGRYAAAGREGGLEGIWDYEEDAAVLVLVAQRVVPAGDEAPVPLPDEAQRDMMIFEVTGYDDRRLVASGWSGGLHLVRCDGATHTFSDGREAVLTSP